jgi:hypothetical protein
MRQGRVGIPALALLASLLAHAGFLAWAGRSPRRGPPPVVPIELELVEVPPAAAPVPAGEAIVTRPLDSGARLPPRGRASRRPGGAVEPAAPPPSPGSGPGPAVATGAPGPVVAPEATVLPPAPEAPAESPPPAARETVLAGREPDLSLRWPAPGGPGEGDAGPAGEGGAGEPGGRAAEPPEAERLARRVETMLTADAPFRRARESADPYWIEVKNRLQREFVVPAEVVEDRPGGGFGPQTREFARAYLAAAERYGKTGSWQDPDLMYAPHAKAIADIAADLPQFESTPKERIEPGEDATRIVSWVRVSFAPDGAVLSISLDRSSGVPAHDRLAMEAAESLPNLGPRPVDQADTLWAFETALWIVPPAPVAGCALDATFVPGPCFYPLKRMVRSRVRLEAVE